jgi:hypothetical protein
MVGWLNKNTTVDTSVDVIGAGDRAAETVLLIMWIGAFWVMAMIWYTAALADRWRGPHGTSNVGFAGVVGAFICSAAWPLVAVYLMTSK